MNNPFFDQARDGCKKAEEEIERRQVECMYIGPGEHGGGDEQVQIVADLIAKGVDGIAVSPSNAAAMGTALRDGQGGRHPGPDLGLRPARRRTRACASPMSAPTTTTSAPTSRSSCRRSSRTAARSASSRAAPRRPTTTSACRASATRSPARRATRRRATRLTGQNGWTEVDGCPLYTNDDFPLSVQQLEDILSKYPDLDAFMPTGGFPQFVPDAYRERRRRSTRTDRRRCAGPRRRRHAAGADAT